MHKKVHSPSSFTALVGTLPHGSQPDLSPPSQPAHTRTTVTQGPIHTDGNAQVNSGLMALNPPAVTVAPTTGQFTVANNNFAGRAVLVLGKYRLISNIDFIPGGGVAATATAIAAAITRLGGYAATALGAVVTVDYEDGPADHIDFKAEHYGVVNNFTPFVPNTGLMAFGSPDVEPPLLT